MNQQISTVLTHQDMTEIPSVSRVELSVQMLDKDAMRRLNHQFRDSDKPTNVLSFESGLPLLYDDQQAPLLVLGDVVFCPEIIEHEACEQHKHIEQHWAHMLVHGTLHLCGYDHIASSDAIEMEALEVQILASLGVPNPYQTQAAQ